MLLVRILPKARHATLCDKTDKTDRHDIADILLKVALNTIKKQTLLFCSISNKLTF
jgi:hypothetical protein